MEWIKAANVYGQYIIIIIIRVAPDSISCMRLEQVLANSNELSWIHKPIQILSQWYTWCCIIIRVHAHTINFTGKFFHWWPWPTKIIHAKYSTTWTIYWQRYQDIIIINIIIIIPEHAPLEYYYIILTAWLYNTTAALALSPRSLQKKKSYTQCHVHAGAWVKSQMHAWYSFLFWLSWWSKNLQCHDEYFHMCM